jgi:hypothetical protein
MGNLIRFGARRPWLVLLILAVVTAIWAAQLPRLEINIAAQGLSVADEEWQERLKAFEQRFPREDTLALYFRDPDLLAEKNLVVIRDVLDQIKDLEGVRSVTSLFNVNNVKSSYGEITSQPYLERLPGNEAESQSLLTDAASNPLITENLIARDGTAMVVRVALEPDTREPEAEARLISGIDEALAPALEELEQAFQLGPPIVRHSITQKIRQDQVRILSGAALVLLVTLAILLRRINGAFIPLLTALLSVLWTLGFMAATGISLNVMTSIVPALLVIVGSTEDVHLLTEYYAGRRKGLKRPESLERMSRHMGTAIFVTGLTTYLGFLSIVTNRIQVLQEFAIAASTGILFNFLITALLVPAWLALTDRSKTIQQGVGPEPAAEADGKPGSERADGGNFRRGPVVAAVIITSLIALFGISQLKVDNDPYSYFDSTDPLIERIHSASDGLAGIESFSVLVTSDIEETFLKVRYLEEIENLQTFIDGLGVFDKTLSFADYIRFINAVMEEDMDGGFRLPYIYDIVRA